MARLVVFLPRTLVDLCGLAVFAGTCGDARGQVELIGARGGSTLPTVPVLPPDLVLPDEVASSLLNGLNSSGTALRPGMGWLVNDVARQGFVGRELSDIIHQLKPY